MSESHTMNLPQLKFLVPLLLLPLAFGSVAWAQNTSPIFEYDPTTCQNDIHGDPLSARCELMISAYPRPANVEPVPLDLSTMGTYSFWRVGPGATPTFDAPNGNVVGEIPAGYNFVTAINVNDPNWLQIQGGQWVPRDLATYYSPSGFTGVEITDGLAHPFAWVLDMSRIAVSRFPGGPYANEHGRFLERYEVVNIFAEAYDDEGWRWYMIGPNEWVKQTFVSKVKRVERPQGVSGHWVAVDLYEQTLVAYVDDTPVFATLISSGLPPNETNEGLFEIWEELPVDPMSGSTGAPDAYALQSVPWVMYFDGGISLHGSYWHDYFGYRQSHGCVNMTISDAKWLYNWFEAYRNSTPELATTHYVYVYSSGEYGQPAGNAAPEATEVSVG